MVKVIKREGRHVDFDMSKISKAISKAKKEISCTEADPDEIAKNVVKIVEDRCGGTVNVEDLQNYVISEIRKAGFDELANVYSSFREKKRKEKAADKVANILEKVMKGGDVDVIKQAARKLLGADVDNQNANVDGYSFGGRMGEAAGIITKYLALNYCMSPRSADNHKNNRIYVHDADSYITGMHNCLTIPLSKWLANGVKVRNIDIRPAKSIGSAMQLMAVFFQLQSLMQFGGVAAGTTDWDLVPYLKMSFVKHYIISYIKSSEKFIDLDLMNMSDDDIDEWVCENKKNLFNEMNLKEEDIIIDNKDKLDKFHYQSALFDTTRELKQATEALYHNLNSLLSRSGNQLYKMWPLA